MHQIAHHAHLELRTPVLEESVAFFTDYLGLTPNGESGDSVFLRAASPEALEPLVKEIVLDDGSVAGGGTTFTNKGYDAVCTRDRTGTNGRLHHIAFATDTREDILKATDIALEQGVFIETGPHKHAIQQNFFLYVYEPGGTRIELCNAGARLVLAPDLQPVNWTEAERAKGQAWGLQTIASFHTQGTPPVEGAHQ